MKLFILGAAILTIGAFAFAADPIDLNAATYEQIRSLPLAPEQADAIWQHLLYEGPFDNFYGLSDLPEIDAKTLKTLRDLVRVNPPRPVDERVQRIEDAYYRIEQLGTEEGTNVGLVDEWIDRLMEPLNVNEATLDELMDIQNVSPADAVAIYKQVKLQGSIRGTRDLRAVPGLSSWGYRNARNYLGYDVREISRKLHGTYTFRAYNTPFFSDEELAVDPAALVDPTPDVSHKIRLTYNRDYKAGLLWHRNLGEETMYSTTEPFNIPDFKWFAGIEKQRFGSFYLDRLYLGNYQVSMGQGVVMESGDYFSPRYSGFGFDKRITGVAPDLSRSQEFTLRGIAAEGHAGPFKAIGFVSAEKKDAIINPDGSFNRLITLVPRTDEDIYPSWQPLANGDSVYVPIFEGKQSMLDAVTEVGMGGEIAYRPWIGTSIGLTATQFMYDKPLSAEFGKFYTLNALTDIGANGQDTVVEIASVVDQAEVDEIRDNVINSEVLNSYSSSTSSWVWNGSKALRRAYGIDLMSVVNNYTFQFEYGELENIGSYFRIGDDPHALVASAHAQWNSFTMLALYRDYSIGYDNPYCRGFANYQRFKGTIYEDEFYLGNPVFAQVHRHSASPQAERGVYLETRYQVSRPLLLVGEIDNWTRVADQADYYRWVGKITYRPIWPLVIRLRQKLQGRWNYDPEQATGFQTYENRLNVEFRLSRYDDLELLYASGYTRFTPRPRLTGEADPTGESPVDGQTASPSSAMGVQLTHNFSPRLKARGAWLVYDGFFWNFEDNEFTVLDDKASRWWFSISNRFSDALSVRFKLTGDSSYPKTWIQARDSNSYPDYVSGREYTGDNASENQLTFRIQVDYLF